MERKKKREKEQVKGCVREERRQIRTERCLSEKEGEAKGTERVRRSKSVCERK